MCSFHSVPFHSIWFNSIQLNCIIHSTPLHRGLCAYNRARCFWSIFIAGVAVLDFCSLLACFVVLVQSVYFIRLSKHYCVCLFFVIGDSVHNMYICIWESESRCDFRIYNTIWVLSFTSIHYSLFNSLRLITHTYFVLLYYVQLSLLLRQSRICMPASTLNAITQESGSKIYRRQCCEPKTKRNWTV